jgi:hypothetical protein
MFGYVIVAVVSIIVGVLFSGQIKADAVKDLAALKAALTKTGVKLETYLSGDLTKIKAEAESVLAKVKL